MILVSPFMIFVSLLTTGIALFICRRIYTKYDVTTAYTGQQPMALGGWLLLPMAGILFMPLIMLAEIINAGFFKQQMTDVIFNSSSAVYNPTLGAVMITELVINSLMITLAVFCLVLLYKKRSIFPNFYIAFVLAMFGINLLYLFLLRIPVFHQAGVMVAPAGGFLRLMIQSFIWIPYMLNSQRVKKTFTRWHTSRVASSSSVAVSTDTKKAPSFSNANWASEVETEA